ncbi:MAG: DUF481 domain-containing protein [Planctomycetota bacterium]|jgi:putative salt-induced outer membrane protein YdiY
MATATLSYADTVTLKGGDVIHGKVIEQNDDGILLEHQDLGQIRIASDRIVSVSDVSVKTMQSPDPAEPQTGPPTPRHLLEDPTFDGLKAFSIRAREKGWSSSIDLSLTSESGNTDERSFRMGGKLGREYSNIKFTSDLTYYNKESDGEITDDKLTIGLVRDKYPEDSDWFFFMMGRYDYDQFESWRHRAAVHTGPGYKLIQRSDLNMDLRAGPGLKKEWGSETTDPELEGVAGTNIEWKPTKKQTFNFSTFFYTVLDDFDNHRTRTIFDWDYLLSDEIDLSLVLGISHEYQAIVDPGKDKNDTRIYTGIRYKF